MSTLEVVPTEVQLVCRSWSVSVCVCVFCPSAELGKHVVPDETATD